MVKLVGARTLGTWSESGVLKPKGAPPETFPRIVPRVMLAL